jgi:hypothetical protein
MARFFNTAGPVDCRDHYCVPPLGRFDLDDVLTLIGQKKYFLLHAPRQTGKTTYLLALMAHLNAAGRYRALYANIEAAQTARENVALGIATVVQVIASRAQELLGDPAAPELARGILRDQTPLAALGAFLTAWCEASPQPVVLLLDEVDSLVGDTLISLLRQLRAGYDKRPVRFPQSIILCGVRDLRDYRMYGDNGKALVTGGSAFNIKAESLRMGDFTPAEVALLYRQHTEETGQVFAAAALASVWELTLGQPWLVNALGYEVCFRMKEGRDRAQPITAALLFEAKEALIQRRETHLDQLADKLREPRVRRVIEPMLAGRALGDVSLDDRQYVIDLGLVRRDPEGGLVMANPIYREVIPRVLASGPQDSLPNIQPTWLHPDGSLDAEALLAAFLAFWRRHGQPLLGSAPYHEIAPHLVLMAFLHRVTNGGGSLEREYAIGSGRMDLCLRYGALTLGIELKVWRDNERDPLDEGLAQLDGYLDGLGQETGWLVIFDRRAGQPPISQRTEADQATSPTRRTVTVIRA